MSPVTGMSMARATADQAPVIRRGETGRACVAEAASANNTGCDLYRRLQNAMLLVSFRRVGFGRATQAGAIGGTANEPLLPRRHDELAQIRPRDVAPLGDGKGK